MKQITSFGLLFLLVSLAPGDDWPQWMGPNRDGVWSEKDILEKFPKDGPKVLWRTPIGSGYTGPAVVGNRVFVMDYITKDNIKKENFDQKLELTGKERILCLSADKGEILWKHEYDRNYKISYPTGPRCTPTVHEGKVYALGAEGDLFCLDAEKGSILWSKNFGKDYGAKTPLWGFSSHPLVDGKKLICIVGGEGSTVVAFDKDSGKEIWKAVSDKEQGYAPPSIIESGGKRQLLIWDGDALRSLDPENGKEYWSVPLPTYQSMSIMTPKKDGDYLFVGAVYGTSVGLKLDKEKPGVSEVWRGPKNQKGKGLYPCNITPWVEDGVLYGCDQPGQFRAVKIDSGEQLWESWLPVTGKEESKAVPCGTAFVVKNGKRFFLFNEKGELIIANITPKGYEEISRTKLLEPTSAAFGRDVVWSHPAFANKCCFARNDKEIICVSLAK